MSSRKTPPAPTNGRLVVGRNPVLECLRARKRRAQRLYLLRSGEGLEALERAAREAGTPVEHLDRSRLDQLSRNTVHQGAVLEAEPLPLLSVGEWTSAVEADAAPFLCVLDGVEDPHNFGAIVRSAAALGASGVVFAQDRAAPLSPAALKAAAGAMEHIGLLLAPNLVRALDELKEAGFTVAGLDSTGSVPLWQAPLSGRTALVIGSEGKGMRRLVRQQCDCLVRIPIDGAISSLNASVSAAIALSECRRQRHGAG